MTTPLARRELDTPLGRLTLVATPDALVGAYFDDHRRRPDVDSLPHDDASAVLGAAARAYADYFKGRRDDVPAPRAAQGTDFQRAVWDELRRIPCGQTRTYAQIAQAIGRPTATRAVAAAIGANPLTIAVPCHRVIGSDGSLTGYAGGIHRKRWLLAREGALP